jgi:predicted dienelactone hydrolase
MPVSGCILPWFRVRSGLILKQDFLLKSRCMELLDLLILFSEALAVFVLAKRSVPGNTRLVLLSLPVIFCTVQLLVAGSKWQLVPAYILAFFIAAFGMGKFRVPAWLRLTGTIAGALLVLISGLLTYIFPVYTLPEPGGEYTVGTTYLHLTDTSRNEFISADPTANRELMVRVWYPSEAAPTGKPHRYMPPTCATTFAQTKGFPGFMLSHLDLIKPHSFPGLPIARKESPFPVIIFNHGYMWHSSMYTAQLEHLASQGYVVFGIDFTYETPVSVFPDGEKRMFNPVFIDTIWRNVSFDSYTALQDSFLQAQIPDKKVDLMRTMMDYTPYTHRIDHMALDVKFVIDEIEAMNTNASSQWFGQLDINRIGVMGHSVGGAVAGVVCSIDPRIKAGMNLDGTQWGSLIDSELNVPFLFMTALRDSAYFDAGIFIYEVVARNDFYNVTIAGTEHASFGDLSFWSKLHALTQTGPIDGYRAIEIINDYTTGFFDTYLKNQPCRLLEGAHEKYPEVKIRQVTNKR